MVQTAALVGCGGGEGGQTASPTTEAAIADTVTPSVEVGQENYFDGEEHVGERVTIVGRVVEDLAGDAVVLNAAAYGDASLLVLSRGNADTLHSAQGEISVTGTVGRFSHGEHVEEFDLAAQSVYEPYLDEKFLLAEQAVITPSSSAR
ncbi:MAG: hypothetical protein HOV94_29945 [Saccharothrix sp.]|nr:hypothetical protein [Saccharothrix sp.]